MHVVSVRMHLFSTLESKLLPLQGLEDKQSVEGVQRELVFRCLTELQQSGTPEEDVKEKLCELCQKKFLITESVYLWSLKKIREVFTREEDLSLNSAEPTSPADPQHTDPLFSKDTIYHASICCQALACCTAGDYQNFFKDTQRVSGHSFQAISISHPTSDGKQHERYLIAKQGESKYYIAFESQPVLSQWLKKCHSFIDG